MWRRERWTPGINAIGTARAENGVELAVEIGGVVKEINFKANQRFTKGDVWSNSTTRSSGPTSSTSQAAVKLSEANLERSTTLRLRGFDTQAAYDQAGRPTRHGALAAASASRR